MLFKTIVQELKEHSPFTIFGAFSGILLMIVFRHMPHKTAHDVFYVLHPAHVFFSALVTASLFKLYRCTENGEKRCPIGLLLVIGYFGSIGIATLSDSVIPFIGEKLLNMPHSEPHIGFIEMGWLINPLALLGIAIAFYRPSTKIPHAIHVLISTWASIFHVMMAKGEVVHWPVYIGVFLFLFLSVWLPCCVSDIVFPLLFVGKEHIHSHHH